MQLQEESFKYPAQPSGIPERAPKKEAIFDADALTRALRIAGAVLVVASLISSLVMLDSNIVAVALPTIASNLNASFSEMQWVLSGYVLPFASLLLVSGALGDIYGRRRAAIVGQVVFAAASLACGLATSPMALIASRALQGAGASMLLTAATAIINATFQGADRARAYAFFGASLGIAITIGPIVGGLLSSLFGWHWVFLVNPPLCVALIVASGKVLPESSDPNAKRLDVAGFLTFSAGLFLLTWALVDGNVLGWLSSPTLARLAIGAIFVVAFVLVEAMQRRPMVDLALFRSRKFLGSAAAMLGYSGGAQVMIFYLPLFLQVDYGFSAARAGFSMLPFALPMFLAPRVAGKLSASWLPRTMLSLGLGVAVAANLCIAACALLGVPYAVFAFAMVFAGTGAGLLNGETSKALQGSVPVERAGMASGISTTTRFTGLLLGISGLGAVLTATATARLLGEQGRLSLGFDTLAALARRFASGDVAGVVQSAPPHIRMALEAALRRSFDGGFATAGLCAATVAATSLLLTNLLLRES